MKYATLAQICLLAAIACQMVTAKWPKQNSEKAKKRQKDAKDKFQKLKKSDQLDRMIGDNTLRADKHGGKIAIQRRGQYFAMKVKEIVERHSNDTEVSFIHYSFFNFFFVNSLFFFSPIERRYTIRRTISV